MAGATSSCVAALAARCSATEPSRGGPRRFTQPGHPVGRLQGKLPRPWSESVTQPTGAPPVKVARVRPALVFPEDQANQLLRAAEAEDVTAGGIFSAGPAGMQVW